MRLSLIIIGASSALFFVKYTSISEAAASEEPRLEQAVWRRVQGVWCPVHGNFLIQGASLEWHDFYVGQSLDWGASFHPESLEICLNFAGQATLGKGSTEQILEGEQVAVYTTGRERTAAARAAESMHRFFTLELSPDFLRKEFAAVMANLKPQVVRFLENPAKAATVIGVDGMPSVLLGMRVHLLEPPVNTAATGIWYHGKILEILSQTLFRENQPAELFCHQHRRRNRERVERVKFILERDLENPPSLEMLAAEVECSSFYLSRLFSQETGNSIPKYLRLKRLEKAGELLRAGRMNVTDTAMAVGYSSLSAFNKAFVEHYGMPPGLYSAPARKRQG